MKLTKEICLDKQLVGHDNHLPLLRSLYTLRVELLDSNHHTGATLGWIHGPLINPSLVNLPKSTLPKNCISPEILGSILEFSKGEDPEISGLKNLAVWISIVSAYTANGGWNESTVTKC
ncbi:Os06g0727500 [Oryza sativa Japonica Group]|uniref:Os06g0727500 protein n=1 Tax=Oryza sativa subsp. japonica TaxID=39947 RepID=A0A0P0X1E4_ORYSJ|nr:Os06g0727500 [Oryza sativa Japonica Group]